MHYSKLFGIAAPEIGWTPAPTYILRRALILKLITNYPPGRVLEIGCGAGALLYDLSLYGFYGVGVEQSLQALIIANKLLAGTHAFEVINNLPGLPEITGRFFDYVISFEVLEHIEDDQAALNTWSNYLRLNEILLISVPAHKSKWNKSDIWAGHYRRYERAEILTKVEKAGFEVIAIHCYGWPLSNLIEPIRSWVHGRKLKREALNYGNPETDRHERTSRSGIDRTIETRLYPLYASWFGKAVFSFFIHLQRYSLSTDWGTGYLVVARKP
jgi:SAM-dependent methyltransferase